MSREVSFSFALSLSSSHSPPIHETSAIRFLIDGSYDHVDTKCLKEDIRQFFPSAKHFDILPGSINVLCFVSSSEVLTGSPKFIEADRIFPRTNLQAKAFEAYDHEHLLLTTHGDLKTYLEKKARRKPPLTWKSSSSSSSPECGFQPVVTLKFFHNRFHALRKLPEGWKHSDEEEDQEFPDRLPPSRQLCERIFSLLVQNISYFQTNKDLPHICPMEEYSGLSMFWLQGLNMRFYDEIHHPDGSHSPASYYMAYIKPSPMIVQKDRLDRLQDFEFKKFLEYLK